MTSNEVEKINIAILALDLGTNTGWALRSRDGQIMHGTESFTPKRNWTPGQRWQRFRSWLSQMIVDHQVHQITFERVVFGAGSITNAAAIDVYGAFKCLVEMLADSHGIEVQNVGVSTVKKHFTGNGRAKKPDMLAEAQRRGFRPDSDNAADALAILSWAVKQEAGNADAN